MQPLRAARGMSRGPTCSLSVTTRLPASSLSGGAPSNECSGANWLVRRFTATTRSAPSSCKESDTASSVVPKRRSSACLTLRRASYTISSAWLESRAAKRWAARRGRWAPTFPRWACRTSPSSRRTSIPRRRQTPSRILWRGSPSQRTQCSSSGPLSKKSCSRVRSGRKCRSCTATATTPSASPAATTALCWPPQCAPSQIPSRPQFASGAP
mmetsp:Transcript_20143/g.77113  ORF Transcript_20143/g.77113 Transcript_20143/m.77113 type:complete len:212 (-) Transcript_20143:656-1291(-)